MKKYDAFEVGDIHEPLKNQIEVKLTPEQFPQAYNAKLEELIEQGMSKEFAEEWLRSTTIVLDVYYSTEKDTNNKYCKGLFMVESEVVECSTIYNPYNGEIMEEYD